MKFKVIVSGVLRNTVNVESFLDYVDGAVVDYVTETGELEHPFAGITEVKTVNAVPCILDVAADAFLQGYYTQRDDLWYKEHDLVGRLVKDCTSLPLVEEHLRSLLNEE